MIKKAVALLCIIALSPIASTGAASAGSLVPPRPEEIEGMTPTLVLPRPEGIEGMTPISHASGAGWERTEYLQQDGRIRVAEKFFGAFAKQYMTRKSRHSTGTLLAQRRAERRLRQEGYTQHPEATVVLRSYLKDFAGPTRISNAIPTAPQTAEASNGQAEVIMAAWNGPDWHWVGQFYAEDYGTGGWVLGSMKIDLSDVPSQEQAHVVWYDHAGDAEEEGGGGGGPIEVEYVRGVPVMSQVVLASNLAEIEFSEELLGMPGWQHPNQQKGDTAARDFVECQVVLVVECGVSCIPAAAGGALYFVCGFACHSVGSVIQCVLVPVLWRSFWDWWDSVP